MMSMQMSTPMAQTGFSGLQVRRNIVASPIRSTRRQVTVRAAEGDNKVRSRLDVENIRFVDLHIKTLGMPCQSLACPMRSQENVS